MGLQSLTLTIVGITFAIYIGIAFWARAKSTQEFYVAGGDINPVANGMATAADWMSAASFISMAGLIAFLGYGGSVFFFQAEDGIRDVLGSRGLGDVYKRQCPTGRQTCCLYRRYCKESHNNMW